MMPRAISVIMFASRRSAERKAEHKNVQPPQRTIGVVRTKLARAFVIPNGGGIVKPNRVPTGDHKKIGTSRTSETIAFRSMSPIICGP